MADELNTFESRRRKLILRHQALARGSALKLRPDGLIVREPRQIRFRLPLRGFVLLMGMFMAYKGFVLAGLGADDYYARLRILDAGMLHERATAFVMGIDPVSEVIADLLQNLK